MLDGNQAGRTARAEGRCIAPVEADHITGRERTRPISIFVHPEAVNARVSLGPNQYPVVWVTSTVEVVAAPVYNHIW